MSNSFNFLKATSFSFTEGNFGTTPGNFTLSFTPEVIQGINDNLFWLNLFEINSLTFNYQTVRNSAQAGSDFLSTSGSATILLSEINSLKTISVPIVGDKQVEPDETFYLKLSTTLPDLIAQYLEINNYQEVNLTATIKNDDVRSLSINNITVTEGNTGKKSANFTVSLSSSSNQIVTVKYNTQNGNAVTPSDYDSLAGTLTFQPGQTTKTISVLVKGDSLIESDEKFYVNLSSPSNAAIASAKGTGVIKNDDIKKSKSSFIASSNQESDLLLRPQSLLTSTRSFNTSLAIPQDRIHELSGNNLINTRDLQNPLFNVFPVAEV